MSIQNNPLGNNTFALGGKVKQTSILGNNSAIANNATQATTLGNNNAFVSQDLSTLFSSTGPIGESLVTPDVILAFGKKHSLAKQKGANNMAAGYQHINQVYTYANKGSVLNTITGKTPSGINTAYGTNFNDHIVQNGLSNSVTSGEGSDVISVKGVANSVNAGDGSDKITVKQASQIGGWANSAKINGGNGNDTVQLYGKASDWTIIEGPNTGFGNALINSHVYKNKNGDIAALTDVENVIFAQDKAPSTIQNKAR